VIKAPLKQSQKTETTSKCENKSYLSLLDQQSTNCVNDAKKR